MTLCSALPDVREPLRLPQTREKALRKVGSQASVLLMTGRSTALTGTEDADGDTRA